MNRRKLTKVNNGENKKVSMIRVCRFGAVVATTALSCLVSGCMGFKTGPVETTRTLQKTEIVSYSILADNGVTPKISFENENAILRVLWQPKVKQTLRKHYKEEVAIYGTTEIGLFPGVGAMLSESELPKPVTAISGVFACLTRLSTFV